MSCGDCLACCKTFEIKDVDSRKGENCQHCTKKGCSIYEKRPEVCKGFECGFLTGGWREELRPDKCGVIIQQTKQGDFEALRIQDKVSPIIFSHIKFIEEKYKISVKGIDARR